MQHFLNLEKCTCGAYRYLAVREHKKSYEIYLIHHRHFTTGQDVRKYSKLASIPKFKINIHDQRVDQQPKDKSIQLSNEQVLLLKSVLRKLGSLPDEPTEIEENAELTAPESIEDPLLIETNLA
jgi:hypothetical protein